MEAPQLAPCERHLDRRTALDGLVDDAIAFGQLEQLIKLVLRRSSIDVKS